MCFVCLKLLLPSQALMNPEFLASHLQKEELSPKYHKEMAGFRSHPKLFFSDPNCNKDWEKNPKHYNFSPKKSNPRKLAGAT